MTRIAIVHKERCNPQGCGGYLCIRVCPENRMGKECIVKDPVDNKVKINESQCGSGVQVAVNRCPFDALEMINLPEELTKMPIHKYSPNGFHLYNIPTPVFGKVTGIVGRNGIGKSTAIKILAGVLKPNLGTEKEASYDDLLKFFKGTEAQVFFENLKAGKTKIAYKPQQVDLIPKTSEGKVIDLLKKCDERNAWDSVIKELDLKDVLDRDISVLSGGELQRVAIAACALKKASVYIFDEPTSFLDIKQRMGVAKFIKSLASEETAVMVVDHDLIILDYMTDLMHIIYGKEACYGIVSMPKAVRTGLNVFLEGYMKEENMRFRDYAIKFSKSHHSSVKQHPVLTSWKDLEISLENFKLTSKPGRVHKSEVVGILGENGIGKTTFVKALAGVVKAKGEIDKVKVSYKPQYINTTSDEIVAVALKDAIQKYEIQLIRPLDLKHLLTKKISHLSGGELQRVAIAQCLAQDAELYLLDEPSAYLDVEQRIAVAKTVKEFAESKSCSILVVDHDLLFIDYLAEKLAVFEGIPAKYGSIEGPFRMEEGMNKFLRTLDITLRRDQESNRPRINKQGSVADREQKEENKLYYA